MVIDDLRPEFNQPYGQTVLHTPHMDTFADTALTFNRGYVQYSHCSPSRNSFLSGRSPQTTGVYNFIDHFRLPNVGLNWTAMPEFFKNNGYYVAGGGKVYHPAHPPNNDGTRSWDVYYQANGDDGGCRKNETIYNNVCPSAEPDDAFYDNNLAHNAIAQMQNASRTKPFFIAAGLRRPHRVWHVPRRFYDLYPNNGTSPTNMQLAKNKHGPVGMPELAFIDNAWPTIPYNQTTPIPDSIAAMGRWGYYAAVSFTDYNLGLVLDSLNDLNIADNTVVALIGDHGWQLGEHGEWCKRTNFELGVRIPFMIRDPATAKTSFGRKTDHFAEALDLYRTLASLAGFPATAVEQGVEGVDLSPVFSSTTARVRNNAFSQMARCPVHGLGPQSACNSVPLVKIEYMGYSVRTDDYRYTVWVAFNGTRNRGNFSAVHGEELYTHVGDTGTDFDAFENTNLATDDATKPTRQTLNALILEQFDTPW